MFISTIIFIILQRNKKNLPVFGTIPAVLCNVARGPVVLCNVARGPVVLCNVARGPVLHT